MPDAEYVDRLKRISIRGRMALGITCFERICLALEVEDEEFTRVAHYFWEFTSSMELGDWDERLPDPTADALDLLMPHFRCRPWESPGYERNQVTEVMPAYLKAPAVVLLTIECLNQIGGGNLYGGVVGWSEHTLAPTVRLLQGLERIGLVQPDLAPFERSPFTEADGWGCPRRASYFR